VGAVIKVNALLRIPLPSLHVLTKSQWIKQH